MVLLLQWLNHKAMQLLQRREMAWFQHNKMVNRFKTLCLLLMIGMLMMLATTIQLLRPEMITEMGSEMEMVEEDIEEAEETAAEEIKMGKDRATEEMEVTEDLNVEREIIEMNIMEEEVVDVVEALAKETKGEAVVKIDQEVTGEVKTSEEKKGQT